MYLNGYRRGHVVGATAVAARAAAIAVRTRCLTTVLPHTQLVAFAWVAWPLGGIIRNLGLQAHVVPGLLHWGISLYQTHYNTARAWSEIESSLVRMHASVMVYFTG
jgi:hypothetical protein